MTDQIPTERKHVYLNVTRSNDIFRDLKIDVYDGPEITNIISLDNNNLHIL